MKSKILVSLAVWLAAAAVCFAANPQMGTWKLNEKKSHLGHGMGKNSTVVYDSGVFKTKVTIDGTDAKGKPMHSEWSGNFDGKDYAVTGDPTSDMRSYNKVDDRTLTFTAKKGGKVTVTGRIAVAADGKSRTVHATGTDSKGKKFHNVVVYDKA
ncbi:MAG TPA: hypothetical protein VEP30_02205 [Chthoniobacterales bacterium]|nr:hypothetical protein [Chthoniobacterales bacterium]